MENMTINTKPEQIKKMNKLISVDINLDFCLNAYCSLHWSFSCKIVNPTITNTNKDNNNNTIYYK